MKKNICKVVCIISVIISFISIFCALTVTGNGFLDLSNIAKIFFIIIAICSAVTTIITGIYGFKNK